jgi:DNA-binding NarL/FixJ family response regulator/serine phosphatase RsbU (regulator of sigma subunit)
MTWMEDIPSTGEVDRLNDSGDAEASTGPIRALIVDDHAIVRRGIRALLATEPGIEVVAEAVDGREAVAEAEKMRPDVILMDLVMPEMDGIEATRRIAARQPEVRILVLTSFATNDLIFPAIKAGALGYLLKDSSPEELVGAIHQVYRGELSLHPTIAEKVLQEVSASSEHDLALEPLTGREVDVLQSVARGQSNREIASHLGVRPAIVRTHVNDILRKLHLASRTQAVLYALREGLASLDELSPTYVGRLLAMLGKTSGLVSPAGEEGAAGIAQLPTEPSREHELETLRLIAADHQKVGQELALAGEIQSSFLPEVVPKVPGWQLAAALEPARDTAGDFYDFIPLPDGQLGLLVADVADKGMGAALYMALSRTLIRTYAAEYRAQPDLVLDAVNSRILLDTRASLFVTVFYGILDPTEGTLTYCNAGHNPPYLLRAGDRDSIQGLDRTGMPLGVYADVTWERRAVPLAPGEVLVLYTDGITEAQNGQEVFFGKERLLEIAKANVGRSAWEMQDVLLAAVHEFVGEAPQFDDITLMVLVRDS